MIEYCSLYYYSCVVRDFRENQHAANYRVSAASANRQFARSTIWTFAAALVQTTKQLYKSECMFLSLSTVLCLQHGSFGSPPHTVINAQRAWVDLIEENPDDVMLFVCSQPCFFFHRACW